jgi:hypothetical protein
MSNSMIDPAERRKHKFEEMMQRHAAETRSLIGNAYTQQQRYITFYVKAEDDDEENALVLPESITELDATSVKPEYTVSLSNYVAAALADLKKVDSLYLKVHETVADEIELNVYSIAHDNLPPFETNDDAEQEVTFGDEVDTLTAYYAGRVARCVEDHVGITANFVDNAIKNYYGTSSIDMLELLDLVSDALTDIITERILDIIEDGLVDIVCTAFYNKHFPEGFLCDTIKRDIKGDSRDVAARISEIVTLAVDDTITNLIVRAFRTMCKSLHIDEESSTSSDAVMNDVAEKVSDLKI